MHPYSSMWCEDCDGNFTICANYDLCQELRCIPCKELGAHECPHCGATGDYLYFRGAMKEGFMKVVATLPEGFESDEASDAFQDRLYQGEWFDGTLSSLEQCMNTLVGEDSPRATRALRILEGIFLQMRA